MRRLNKKGFTLVELLAVIVILALLIVVVANTALPAMNNAKKNSLEVYTERVVNQAKALHSSAQIDIDSVKKADGTTNACTVTSGVYTCTFAVLSEVMGADTDDTYSITQNIVVTYSSGKYTVTGKITGSGFTTTIATTNGKITYTTA